MELAASGPGHTTSSLTSDAVLTGCLRSIYAGGATFPVRPRDIGGGYSRCSEQIKFTPFPNYLDMTAGNGAELSGDLMAFRFAMRSLLAHEVSHRRQHQLSDGSLDQAMSDAEAAGELADRTRNYQDYLKYLRLPVEVAAHATQMAVEVFDSYGASLTKTEFMVRCKQSWVLRRVWRSPMWLYGGDENARFDAFLPGAAEWIDQADFAYKRLVARQAPSAEVEKVD